VDPVGKGRKLVGNRERSDSVIHGFPLFSRREISTGPQALNKETYTMEQTSLFTAALGLQHPWEVIDVQFSGKERRIDFEVAFEAGSKFTCAACAAEAQPVHDTLPIDASCTGTRAIGCSWQ
tara:strand:+ start:2250 stop:2615 length:366 start_codon:yes stop_codon:yes gene_type:complete